jgi:hypothetical protein
VAAGVVGVAAVQSVLAGAGLYLADVPAAGIWAALVLILAVAQLPPALILVPAILYVVTTSDSLLTQVLFTAWSLLVSVSDALLKPLMLGRGMKIPMPVILIGAIGGLIQSGFISSWAASCWPSGTRCSRRGWTRKRPRLRPAGGTTRLLPTCSAHRGFWGKSRLSWKRTCESAPPSGCVEFL